MFEEFTNIAMKLFAACASNVSFYLILKPCLKCIILP